MKPIILNSIFLVLVEYLYQFIEQKPQITDSKSVLNVYSIKSVNSLEYEKKNLSQRIKIIILFASKIFIIGEIKIYLSKL